MPRTDGDNLYRRNGVWYARVQVAGRDIRRSLRTASRIEAKKRLTVVLEKAAHWRTFGEARHAWKDAVVEWAGSAPEIAPATFRRYLSSLRQLRPWLDALHIDEITTKTIAQIARRPGISNATRRRDLTALSVVLRWCIAQGWRDDNPAAAWDRSIIRERREPVNLPNESEIDAVIALAPGNLARLIRLAQYTGMREEEVASLEWRQVDSARGAITLTRTKTNRPRAVPLDERASRHIAGTPPMLGCPYVFWHGAGERYRNVASRFAAIAKRAPRRFRFHDLRHWFAVDYLRRGGGIYRLQQILGHSSIKTTELYLAYLTPAEGEAAKTERAG